MKQGQKRKLTPKDKHTTAWWKRRDESRKVNQQVYAANQERQRAEADAVVAIAESAISIDVSQ